MIFQRLCIHGTGLGEKPVFVGLINTGAKAVVPICTAGLVFAAAADQTLSCEQRHLGIIGNNGCSLLGIIFILSNAAAAVAVKDLASGYKFHRIAQGIAGGAADKAAPDLVRPAGLSLPGFIGPGCAGRGCLVKIVAKAF